MRELPRKAQLSYLAEYAWQQPYAEGDPRIDARYRRLGGGILWPRFFARVDFESLGSDGGVYGFQAPWPTTMPILVGAICLSPRPPKGFATGG